MKDTATCSQVYICELGRCLLKLKDSSDSVLELRMRELTIEAISLVGHRLLRNPASHKDLATGQMNQDQAAQHKLDANFYKNLLVSYSFHFITHCSTINVSQQEQVCTLADRFVCLLYTDRLC